MNFQILSHAGMRVTSKKGKELVFDPWIIGSCYWRSWWNYPEPKRELLDSLNPDVIYITHIHWDHFHGPSLNRFKKDTLIIVPAGNYTRNRDDLVDLGFTNVKELRHGESYQIDDDFKITSYAFEYFLDSAAIVECDGTTLLNLNDSKHMGITLKQIVKNHNPIDFVFRSHSSANERLNYRIVDETGEPEDNLEQYCQFFLNTCRATGAKYAVPFASNHCHLHKDTFEFNHYVQTPATVQDYAEEKGITDIEVKVMLSGDTWSDETGFEIAENDWFTNRDQHLLEYRERVKDKLEKFYEKEDKTTISKKVVEKYFKNLSKKVPWFLRIPLKGEKFTYILTNYGKPKYIFNIDLAAGTVDQIPAETELDFETYPIQIKTTTFVFLRCIGFRIFSHMSIGKRVFYYVTSAKKGKMRLLNLMYNFDEYDMIPLSRNFTPRSLYNWMLRWRELLLYAQLVRDKYIFKNLDFSKYMRPLKKKKQVETSVG